MWTEVLNIPALPLDGIAFAGCGCFAARQAFLSYYLISDILSVLATGSTVPAMATSQRQPSTGIKVIIVGAGFAGLTAAIECHRKGHEVLVLESFPTLKVLGDIISFAPNSGRIFQRWDGVDAKLDPIIHKSDGILFKTWKGEDLTRQTWGEEAKKYGKAYNGHVRIF